MRSEERQVTITDLSHVFQEYFKSQLRHLLSHVHSQICNMHTQECLLRLPKMQLQ